MSIQPIATRTLRAANGTDEVEIRVYAPANTPFEQDPELFAWQCTYEVIGIERVSTKFRKSSYVAPGIDSLDALQGALKSIRGILDRLLEQEGVDLVWEPLLESTMGHGIPRAISTYLGPRFEREMKEQMLSQERAFMMRETEYMQWLRRNSADDA